MSRAELGDTQLLGRCAAGDRQAFARFFERHAAVVLGVLVRMLGRREEAEEILQEAFLQAWEQAGRYRPERATPRGWLLMLARSRAIDRLRAARARGRREETVWREGGGEVAQPVGSRELEADERRRQLEGALGELPAEQRRCLELAYWEGLSHRQIAERLEQPLGTVKSRVLMGMNKLRQALAP